MQASMGVIEQDEMVPIPPALGPLPDPTAANEQNSNAAAPESDSSSSTDPEDVAEYENHLAEIQDDVQSSVSSGSDLAVAGASGNLEPDDLTIENHEASVDESSDDTDPEEPTSTVHVPNQSGGKLVHLDCFALAFTSQHVRFRSPRTWNQRHSDRQQHHREHAGANSNQCQFHAGQGRRHRPAIAHIAWPVKA